MTHTTASKFLVCLGTSMLFASGASATHAQEALSAERVLTLTPEEKEILSHLRIVYLDDGQGGTVKTLDIGGINVRIHNGLGATNGYPADPRSVDGAVTVTNGLGNLIIGYNEIYGTPDTADRTGSHNLVVGLGNSYTSFGGMVVARRNKSTAPFASVSGGKLNVASGNYSSVAGGYFGRSTGTTASVSGGAGNVASGSSASVTGGSYNYATVHAASVSGGAYNTAWGCASSVSGGYRCGAGGTPAYALFTASSVSGGYQNGAFAALSTVTGGSWNSAMARGASISGGRSRTATDINDWAAGSLLEDE